MPNRLVIAIVQDVDTDDLSYAFREKSIPATKISSTGGFLSEGNTTFLVAIHDEELNNVLEIIRTSCKPRTKIVNTQSLEAPIFPPITGIAYPLKVQIGGATVIVIPILKFENLPAQQTS
ncbi:hypothetical protein B9J78_01210 [bacterium Unc6]|nr:hypothetical protein [bacterium Unc6]